VFTPEDLTSINQMLSACKLYQTFCTYTYPNSCQLLDFSLRAGDKNFTLGVETLNTFQEIPKYQIGPCADGFRF